MDQRSTLRDAIFESPTDFERRQIYGDLLQAQGDPRGAFIAAQCRLRDMDPLHAEYPALFAESERLRADHVASWLKPAMELLGIEAEQRASEALGGAGSGPSWAGYCHGSRSTSRWRQRTPQP